MSPNVTVNGRDWPLLLVTHAACIDEQYHIREADALRELADTWETSAQAKELMEAIIGQTGDAPELSAVIRRVPEAHREEALRYLLFVAHVDGHYHSAEEELVGRVADEWGYSDGRLKELLKQADGLIESTSFDGYEGNDDVQLSFGERLLKTTDETLSEGFVDALTAIAPKNMARKVDKVRRRILLAGEEYDAAVEKCAGVAEVDFEVASKAIQKAYKDFQELSTSIKDEVDSISDRTGGGAEAKSAAEVAEQLEETKGAIDEEILDTLHRLRGSFEAKKRAVDYFTIAFMGRTKVGKSTLHAVLTGQGWEAIGDGRQRKTRINRVYEWKNIRIIDTPGIGAPGGKSDEEIAESVIDEADVICYVVTNDSQQQAEFDFLSKLKERAKPLIILLNVKKNLEDERRRERFLKRPGRVFRTEGHEERIRRYANQHYTNDYFDIIPVQLLAAQLSRQSEFDDESEDLMEASRFQDFLESLRVSLIENGTVRRAQTFLGCTARDLAEMNQWLVDEQNQFEELAARIESQYEKLTGDLDEARDAARSEMRQGLQRIYGDLKNSISSFANRNWDVKSDDQLKSKWQRHVSRKRIEERLENHVESVLDSYSDRVDTALREVGRELELSMELGTLDVDLLAQSTSAFARRFFKIGGGLASAAGAVGAILASNPVGWVVLGVGGAIAGLFSAIFSSKTKKQQKAVKKISNSLRKQVSNSQSKTVKKALSTFNSRERELRRGLDSYFQHLEKGLRRIGGAFEDAQTVLDEEIEALSRQFAVRVLQWAKGDEFHGGYDVSEKKLRAYLTELEHDPIEQRLRIETPKDIVKSPDELERAIQGEVDISTI